MSPDMTASQEFYSLLGMRLSYRGEGSLGLGASPVLDEAGEGLSGRVAAVRSSLQPIEDLDEERDLIWLADLHSGGRCFNQNKLVIEDPEAVKRHERQLRANGQDVDLDGLEVGERADQVELGAHHRWWAELVAKRRLGDNELEPLAGIVEELLPPEVRLDGLVGVARDAIQRDHVAEHLPRVVAGLQHAGDNRRLERAHQSSAGFQLQDISLAGCGAAAELPTPGRVDGVNSARTRKQLVRDFGRCVHHPREGEEGFLGRGPLAALDPGDLRLGPAESFGELLASEARLLPELAEPGAERLTGVLVVAWTGAGQRP